MMYSAYYLASCQIIFSYCSTLNCLVYCCHAAAMLLKEAKKQNKHKHFLFLLHLQQPLITIEIGAKKKGKVK